MAAPLSIAHVTPYPWEAAHEVNAYVRCAAAALGRRGHDVLILAPSRSADEVRRTRGALREARERPERLFEGTPDGSPPVLLVGEVLDVARSSRARRNTRRRTAALAVDAARMLDEIFSMQAFDFVHVYEPFPPGLSSAALRHSRSLNVGSFHAPSEPLLTTQVTRRFVESFFGRLDARTASFATTARLLEGRYPAEYRVVAPGSDEQLYAAGALPQASTGAGGGRPHGRSEPLQLLFVDREERAALRAFLRALRRLDAGARQTAQPQWEATVLSAHEEAAAGATWSVLRDSLRERVRFRGFTQCDENELLARADVIVCASEGSAPAPTLLQRGLASGAAAIASRLPVYEEVLGDGERGLLFEPGDTHTLAGQLQRLIAEAPLRTRLVKAGREFARPRTWERTARELETVYATVASRRHRGTPSAALRRTLARRAIIDVDLHMHTDHSPDCATPVEVLLATARERGLGAIAVTDHNEISGALAARDQAAAAGVKVIVGEEVKTAGQGEVIGLFLEHKIPRDMTLAETVAEIKRQGGIVYVPHPFDRLHAVPDYEHLLPILEDVDAIEVFNPRVAIDTFNEEAVRFAAKYNIAAGAGSDSHVPQGLGSVRLRMHDFDGPQEFLQSLRDADIVTRPTSLLYVQALKFLQTRATPAPARRARSARRVRRLSTHR
jgi:predicted metal-dependent phosphoesterase TrpH/glycosyltransferase involved in cell wall biosynthesis